ncbi:hypothetical protein SMC26_23385 [Actinomadura fulvescens]|uniref:Uncharacterized protein n=1 Tax=Actinomadura fulvescens TaxID=46160 RepID=A0ABP6D226_9ACTN
MNTKRLVGVAVAGTLSLGLVGSVTAPVSAAEAVGKPKPKPEATFVVKLSRAKQVVAPKRVMASGRQRIAVKARPLGYWSLRVRAIRCNGVPLGAWKPVQAGRTAVLTNYVPPRGTCFSLRWLRDHKARKVVVRLSY